MSREEQYLQNAKAYFASQQFSSAGMYARKVIRRQPHNLDALLILAELAFKASDFKDAEYKFDAILTLDPNFERALRGKLHLLEVRQRYFEQVDMLNRLITLFPDELELQFKQGMAALQTGNMALAIDKLTFCTVSHYNHSAVKLNLGHIYKATGNTQLATDFYHQFIIENPDKMATGFWSLADLKNYTFSESDKSVVISALNSPSLSDASRALLLYTMNRIYEQSNQHQLAFEAMSHANKLLAPLKPFKKSSFINIVQSLRHTELTARKVVAEQIVPIFIVGMPRSGTTLVEQILACHSLIGATDELPYIERIALTLEQTGGYAKQLAHLSQEKINQYQQEYLQQSAQYFSTVPDYVIDKNPNNFLHIGLIKTLFPQAKIINVIRHTTDNALSVFKQYFSFGHDYSYSLENIKVYWENYLTLMEHWDSQFPQDIYHLSFEKLVIQPDDEIPKLLSYCGVDFETACLHFYQSTRPVLTPSASQVRQPMNTKAIGQCEKYQAFMGQDYVDFEQININVRHRLLGQ
ncbi:tetratricopeptide repeat-containing sulfotransferase family protein [Shewanella glacialipiscicola]|uniref:tetratricopeptide repeat-containing sulfotransferase family protein n=1 Tax=Shewanella glacialipiscicola TaxID=614069 RepID=UPI003D7BFCDD